MVEALQFAQMQAVVAPVQLQERSMLVSEQAIDTEVAILNAILIEVEEFTTILLLVLVTVASHALFSELLLPMGELAGISPAFGRGNPVKAQLVTLLQTVAILIVIVGVRLNSRRIATILHVIVDYLRSCLLDSLGVLRAAAELLLGRQGHRLRMDCDAIWHCLLLEGHLMVKATVDLEIDCCILCWNGIIWRKIDLIGHIVHHLCWHEVLRGHEAGTGLEFRHILDQLLCLKSRFKMCFACFALFKRWKVVFVGGPFFHTLF